MRKTSVTIVTRGLGVARRWTACSAIAEARRLEVLVEVGFESEGFVTFAAVVRFGGRVRLHVSAQVGAIGKRLTAMGTAVGFLARVRSHVTLQ